MERSTPLEAVAVSSQAPPTTAGQERLPKTVASWRPAKGGGDLALVDVEEQRQGQESSMRARWIKELACLVEKCGLPAAGPFVGPQRELAMKRLGKGRRPATLRKHVRTWQRISRWISCAFGVSWPSAEHFVAYLHVRAAEPCGRTVHASCLKSLLFLESAGELSEADKVSRHPAIRNSLEELALELSDKDLRGKRQACQLLVTQVCAMERLVVSGKGPRFIRAFAWFRLFKLWGCLRYSDTEGMPAKSVSLEHRGLCARLDRTKTSGPGKKLEVLFAYVSKDAWLVEADWLSCGWPSRDLEGCVGKMARYCRAAAMSQALFQSLEIAPCKAAELAA